MPLLIYYEPEKNIRIVKVIEKARKGYLVVSDKDANIKKIPAKDL